MCRMSGSVCRQGLHGVLPVIVSVLLGACASGGVGSRAEGSSAAESVAEPSDALTQVMVANHSWERVTVYISQGAAMWRLGEVEAKSERVLPLRNLGRSLLGTSAFFVGRPLAGTAFRSESFAVNPRGGIPTWTIENHTAVSFVTLR